MVAARAYSGRPLAEALDAFASERRQNIELVRAMPAEVRVRRAVHQRIGPLTLEELLSECGFHELGHLKQIAELLRAQRYYPAMGPFQREYKIAP
jgi:hypothetical protein